MVAPATAEEIGHVADRQLDRDANAVEDQDDLEVPACVKGASAISVRARRKGLNGPIIVVRNEKAPAAFSRAGTWLRLP